MPRRAYPAMTALSAILLGGLLGCAWWWRRGRYGPRAPDRFHRLRVGAVAAGLALLALGIAWRLTAAVTSVSPCSPPNVARTTTPRAFDAELVAERSLTWPETGLGMLYARADRAHVCWSRTAGFYVALHADAIGGAHATNVGDIVLSPRFDMTREQLTTLAGHEARHRPQWAIATVIAGPLAFPVAYGIDNFFFPASRNHFERMAGLESGFYPRTGTGPVLGPAQITVLVLLGIAGVALTVIMVRSRRDRRSVLSRQPPPDP